MNERPKCVIVTGRPGAGKSTLARALAVRLRMPVISRDEIKEGYVNTRGVSHEQLPPDTNAVVTELFFEIVNRYLAGKISVVIEAAFQHRAWEARIPRIVEFSSPVIVLCCVKEAVAEKRHLLRGLRDPDREFYHGAIRSALYIGEISPPESYEEPQLNVPTVRVSTDGEYVPAIDEIVQQIQSSS